MPRAKSAPPKWRRCPQDRPEQILNAALQVFGECGLANARLQDIAERAGVSKGTIYLYFPNKEELFREMIRQTAVAAIERAEQTVTHGTPTVQLLTFMRGYWTFVRSPVFSTIYRLVGVHTVFGKVIEGLDVVPKISQNDTVSKARVTSDSGAK